MPSTPDKKNILDIQDLSITLGQQTLVDQVSFSLTAGSILGIVGESGAGKSITANAILQLLPKHLRCSGKILFKNQDILHFTEQQLQAIRSQKIAMIFQDPLSSLNPCHTISKQLQETIQIHQKRTPSQFELAEKLRQVDLKSHMLNHYPHQLSGGQRQRVMIAMALCNDPELIICDEATTALDVTTQKQILDLIKHIANEKNIAILMITHNLSVISYIADAVVVLRSGKVIEKTQCEQFFKQPQTAYGQQLLQSYQIPALPQQASEKIILNVQQLTVPMPGNKTHFFSKTPTSNLINNISFTLYEKSTLALVGESGAGKTTIARALLDLLPSQGTIEKDPETTLSYIFQDPHAALNPRFTIDQILSEPFVIQKRRTDMHKIHELCAAVSLPKRLLSLYPHELSGGQKQRVALARTLLLQPKIVILDEPTSALDATTQSQVIQLLAQLKEQFSLTFILITHDLTLVEAICDQIIILKDGQIIEAGKQHDIFKAPSHPYTRQLLAASLLGKNEQLLCDD